MALPKPLIAMLVPVLDPGRNRAAVNLQLLGNLASAMAIQAQKYALDAKHDTGCLLLLSLAAQIQKLGYRPLIAFRK